MTAASGRRIAKLAELVSAEARKQRRGLQPAFGDRVIRYHAIAAAAIALEGLPKIDEPLIEAWNRVLRHFKIELKNPHLFEGQIEAAWELWPKIQNHEDESTRLTEIFSTAPAWFLQFTRLPLDARHLKFDLPRHLMTAVEWGSAGFEEARLWPQLPSGIMKAGDSIPSRDGRQLEIAACSLTLPFSQLKTDRHFRFPRPRSRLLRQVELALDLERKPEEQWTRYQRRMMRELEQRIVASPQEFCSELECLAIDESGAYMGVLAKLLPPPLTNLNSPAMAAIIRTANSPKVAA